MRVFYYNGDLKESHSSGLVKYLYSASNTWHTTQADGGEVTEFSNGQREVRLGLVRYAYYTEHMLQERAVDGTLTISFIDGSTKIITTDGEENITFPDGTTVKTRPNGDRIVHLPNGQKEEYKKRIYPDGTVKTVFADGRQITKLADGRIRQKDGLGNTFQDHREVVV